MITYLGYEKKKMNEGPDISGCRRKCKLASNTAITSGRDAVEIPRPPRRSTRYRVGARVREPLFTT